MKDIGKKIKDLRKQKGFTQKELGNLLHVSFQAVSKWERGESLPDTAMFGELASLLGVTVDDLFYNDEDLSLSSARKTAEPTVIVKTEIVEKPVYKSVNRTKYIIITACAAVVIAVLAILISNSIIKKNQALEKLGSVSSAYSSQSNVKIDCTIGESRCTFVRKYYFDGRVVLYFFDEEIEKYYYEGFLYEKSTKEQSFLKKAGSEDDFLNSIPMIYLIDFEKEAVKGIKTKDGALNISLKKGNVFSAAEALGFTDKAVYTVSLKGGLPKLIEIKEGLKTCQITYLFGYSFTFSVPEF